MFLFAKFNFVVSRSGKLIEIQGTAEKEPLDFSDFDSLKEMSLIGASQVFECVDKINKDSNFYVQNNNIIKTENKTFDKPGIYKKTDKIPLFSLGNRIKKDLEFE